jgi:hypothetical protein
MTNLNPISNPELRLFEIENSLIPMITNTDNELFYRHLPFPKIFINTNIPVGDHLVAKGIMMIDLNDPNITFDKSNEVYTERAKDIALYAVVYDETEGYEFRIHVMMCNRKVINYEVENDSDVKAISAMNSLIRVMACNILDLIESRQEVEQIEYVTDRKHNEKRIKRGKSPMPIKILIRPTPALKLYLTQFNEAHKRFGYKFMVRGHWRHFRSAWYKEKQGTKRWIYPHYRGHGIEVKKVYEVKE